MIAPGWFAHIPSIAIPPSDALLAYSEEAVSLDRSARDHLVHTIGASPIAVGGPPPVKMSRVVFQPDGTYRPCRLGEFVYVLLAGYGETADVAVWSSSSGRTATRFAEAALIGEEQVAIKDMGNPLRGNPLQVWRSPVNWLRSNRRGVVIVNYRLAGHLLSGRVLAAEGDGHRQELNDRLRVELPSIIVLADQLAEAA